MKFEKVIHYGLSVSKNVIGEPVSVICDKNVTLFIQLFIRHGSPLCIRKITWYVETKGIPEPLFTLWLTCDLTSWTRFEGYCGSS